MDRSLQVHARESGGFICNNLPRFIIISVLIVITLSITIFTVILLQYSKFWSRSPDKKTFDDPLNDHLTFVKRVEWGAQPPQEIIHKLDVSPVPYVIISHSGSESCNNQTDCTQQVRLIQMIHMEINGLPDIGYNFLIGGNGLVYVGRGWDNEGSHTFDFDSKSIGICMIGTFNRMSPNIKQLHSLAALIALGVKKNKIRDDYKLLGQSQVFATSSPGAVLYSILQKSDHWSEKP